MDFLGYYLSLNKNCLLGKKELELIFSHLNRILNSGVKGLRFDNFCNSPIRYDFVSNLILLNYDAAISYFNNCVKDIENKIEIINYYLVFSLIHELYHELQMNEKDKDIIKLYKYCYSLINDTHNGVSRVLTQLIYNKLHDYLAIEINANVEAYCMVLQVCHGDVYEYFYEQFIIYLNKVYVEYDLKKMYNEIGYDISDKEFIKLSDEDRIKKGVYLDKEITSLDKVDISKILFFK